MNARRLRNSLSMMTTGLVLMNTAWAGIPVWSFSPIGSPVVSVSATGTEKVEYTITNNSKNHTD